MEISLNGERGDDTISSMMASINIRAMQLGTHVLRMRSLLGAFVEVISNHLTTLTIGFPSNDQMEAKEFPQLLARSVGGNHSCWIHIPHPRGVQMETARSKSSCQLKGRRLHSLLHKRDRRRLLDPHPVVTKEGSAIPLDTNPSDLLHSEETQENPKSERVWDCRISIQHSPKTPPLQRRSTKLSK